MGGRTSSIPNSLSGLTTENPENPENPEKSRKSSIFTPPRITPLGGTKNGCFLGVRFSWKKSPKKGAGGPLVPAETKKGA